MFFANESFPAQLVKCAFDGCAGEMQLRSDGVDREPAAALCICMVLQAAVDYYCTMSQSRVMD